MNLRSSIYGMLAILSIIWAVYFFYYKEPSIYKDINHVEKYYKRHGWLKIGTFGNANYLVKTAELNSDTGSITFIYNGPKGSQKHTYDKLAGYQLKAIRLMDIHQVEVMMVFRSEKKDNE